MADGHRDEDAIWQLLRERQRDDAGSGAGSGAGFGAGPDEGEPHYRFRRDALVPVLDAALGVLAATRHLVEVTEDVLREQRDRLVAEAEPEPVGDEETGRHTAGRKRIDLSY